MWIHEYHNWPNFTWDTEKISYKLADIRYRQGLLLGKMKGLGSKLKREASLGILTNDFQGYMNTSKYAKLTKCSTDIALRDIHDLKTRGVFLQNPGGGRSTSYRLTDKIQSSNH